ncbi:dienelactone hydrolase family protein [Synechococcus sp. RSCCF101]|uniref:dienelactone hydrolase family protein n=1 Tax=Synechococcus sp. RSCCF101 TaxID=2511069 RepID=UPI001CD93C4A|nr:dienelactone hydrolase family protein [Synechococcus sp. RSCCF101]
MTRPDLSPSGSVPLPIEAGWQSLAVDAGPGVRPTDLRCWWARPAADAGTWRGGVLVLPEVFGLNPWIRSVAGRLAGWGYGALAVPLFARTAPMLDLSYGEADLAEGRSHKDLTRSEELLADVAAAGRWLQAQLAAPSPSGLGCVGFCFGGHVAVLASSLPLIAATASFYGAGMASGRPGGGPPTLGVLPDVPGRLLCFCGERDPLIPRDDIDRLDAALRAADGSGTRLRLIRVPEAGHGYMCEGRADHRPAAAAAGWQELSALLRDGLIPPR